MSSRFQQDLSLNEEGSFQRGQLRLWELLMDLLTNPPYEPYIRFTGNGLEFVILDQAVVFTEFGRRKQGGSPIENGDPASLLQEHLISQNKIKNHLKGLREEHYEANVARRSRPNQQRWRPYINKAKGLQYGYYFLDHQHVCQSLGWNYSQLMSYIYEVQQRNSNAPNKMIRERFTSEETRNTVGTHDTNDNFNYSMQRNQPMTVDQFSSNNVYNPYNVYQNYQQMEFSQYQDAFSDYTDPSFASLNFFQETLPCLDGYFVEDFMNKLEGRTAANVNNDFPSGSGLPHNYYSLHNPSQLPTQFERLEGWFYLSGTATPGTTYCETQAISDVLEPSITRMWIANLQ